MQADLKTLASYYPYLRNGSPSPVREKVIEQAAAPTVRITNANLGTNTSPDSTDSLQTSINNLVNSAVQAAYSVLTSGPMTTPPLLNTEA
jgi:hypothetical protein